MNRRLAHSYLDEVVVRQQARPFRMTWRDHARNVAAIVGQALGILIGIALAYLFLVGLLAGAK